MQDETLQWLLDCDEPWTRYRTLRDLLDLPADDPAVRAARRDLLSHPAVQGLIETAAGWPGYPLKRHNDAAHPLYAFGTLADFGVTADDPGMQVALKHVLAHQSAEGAFQSVINIPKAFGGTGLDAWVWVACDAPTLLYALLAMGMGGDGRVERAVRHLAGLVEDNGWRCSAAPELGKFKGPGRREHPCPIANVYALKALSQSPAWIDSPAALAGVEMLLSHWAARGAQKYFLFGIGTDFQKLKYPFVWYDILHVADVLSRIPVARGDPRYGEMVDAITAQADEAGRYTAGSMYRAWKGSSFADKKSPSPWLTFLVRRVQRRCSGAIALRNKQ